MCIVTSMQQRRQWRSARTRAPAIGTADVRASRRYPGIATYTVVCAAALAIISMLCWMDEITHPGQPSLKVMLYWFLPFLYGSANGGEALCT